MFKQIFQTECIILSALSETQRKMSSRFLLMACWKRLHLQFRPRWTSGRTSKSSNGRKIARMARNSTIFGPNESSRRDLFLEKFSKSRNTRKVFEKLRKIFEIFFEKFFERCNLMGDVILSKTSLYRVDQQHERGHDIAPIRIVRRDRKKRPPGINSEFYQYSIVGVRF